ncbi:MAG: hypothetical protein QOF96_1401, partial [Actinomycetota bacterium]|nr:hypothetical protein [Actinomycetota bacterium]
AARTESSAGTLGSTIGMSSFFARLAARPRERAELIRARAVAPAALASEARARRRAVDAPPVLALLAPVPVLALLAVVPDLALLPLVPAVARLLPVPL